jgi:hypothetical protein
MTMERIVEHTIALSDYLHVQLCHSKIPDAVDLVFHVPLTFEFYSANVLRVELYINDTFKGQILMRRWSTSKSAFTIHNNYWQATEPSKTADALVFFHITRGTSIRPASNDCTPLRGFHGTTYVLHHLLPSYHFRKHGEASESKELEPNMAVEVNGTSESKDFSEHNTGIEVHDTSESRGFKRFKHDAAIEGDNNTPEESSQSIESQYFDAEEGYDTFPTHGDSEQFAIDDEADNLIRSDRATPAIFMDGPQPDESSTPARASSDTPAQLTSKTPTETFDEAENDGEQHPATERMASQEIPIWTADPVDEHMFSAESDSEVDVKVDQDDEMFDLPSDIKPTLFTSHGHPSAALQHARPHDPGSGGDTNTHSVQVLDHDDSDPDDGNSDPDDDEKANTTLQSDPIISSDEVTKDTTPLSSDANADEEKTPSTKVPQSKTHRDPAVRKSWREKRKALGLYTEAELHKRLGQNDSVIGSDVSPKPWRGKILGDDANRRESNIRLRKMITKQVKLHELLRASTDNITTNLRERLQPWSADKIDEYETQLDTTIAAAEGVQTHASRKPMQRPSDQLEDSDDDELPSFEDLAQDLSDRSKAKEQALREQINSEERAAEKKPDLESV